MRVGKDCVRRIVFVERLEDNDFFAWIDRRHHRRDHPFGRTASDRDLGFRIDVETEIPPGLARDRFAKVFCAPGDRILIDVVRDGLHRDPFDVVGRGEIREALREVNRAIFHRLARHLANHGLREQARFVRDACVFGNGRCSHELIPGALDG